MADGNPGENGGKRSKFISLEIGRFLAALLVAGNHEIGSLGSYRPAPGPPVFHGFNIPASPSVMFFFTLSGFVMMVAHARDFGKLHRIPRFFWRRACRIYPIYILSLASSLFVIHYSWPFLWKTISLWPFQNHVDEVNPPAWSLRFEVGFYFVFGVSLLPYIGRIILIVWMFVAVWIWFPFFWLFLPFSHLIGLAWYFSVLPEALRWHFFGFLEMYFFGGIIAGFAFVKLHLPSRVAAILLVGAGIAFCVFVGLADWGYEYPTVTLTPFASLTFGAIIFCLATLERAGSLKLPGRLAVLGALSYPLYIFHPVVMFTISKALANPPFENAITNLPLILALLVFTTVLVTLAVTFWIDLPLQRLLRRVGG